MTEEGGSGHGKRPVPVDLDAPQLDDWAPIPRDVEMAPNPGATSGTASTDPSSGSSGKKRARRNKAQVENPNWPKTTYTAFTRGIVMRFYAARSMGMLKRTYIENGKDGFVALCGDLGRELVDRLEESELYNNWADYFDCHKWLDQIVTTNTANVVKGTFEVVNKKNENGLYNSEQADLLHKLEAIQSFSQRFSGNKNKTIPWREQAMKSAFEQHLHGGVVFLPRSAKVVVQPGQLQEGGYGIVKKVRIQRMDGIPPTIDFAAKQSKAVDEREKRQERSMEALACPISHPGIIKFWAINSITMEAYTLWWNGGSLKTFWEKFDSKVSEGTAHENIKFSNSGLTVAELDMVEAYRRNRAKLALALIEVIGKCHSFDILHNDLSPSNVLLHFPESDATKVYIGVCDWGLASRVVEKATSLYGYQTVAELERNRRGRFHVAPELFYVFGPPGTENALDVERSKHMHTKASDAYAVGKLASRIWNEEQDNELLPSSEHHAALAVKLRQLTEVDPSRRIPISEIIERLTSEPISIRMPSSCYRCEI